MTADLKRIVVVSRGMYDKLAVGPVTSPESATKIALEAEEHGWTFEGELSLVSVAHFKAHVDGQS